MVVFVILQCHNMHNVALQGATAADRDLRDQFLRFEIETKQVQSQQARPRLKRYSLNKRDRDSCSRIFETDTETRKMVETVTETETLADLSVVSMCNFDQT